MVAGGREPQTDSREHTKHPRPACLQEDAPSPKMLPLLHRTPPDHGLSDLKAEQDSRRALQELVRVTVEECNQILVEGEVPK